MIHRYPNELKGQMAPERSQTSCTNSEVLNKVPLSENLDPTRRKRSYIFFLKIIFLIIFFNFI